MNASYATLQVNSATIDTKSVYHVVGHGETTGVASWFFNVDDTYESYVNPKTLTPYLYKREINEGGYYKFMKYTFSHKSKIVKGQMRKRRSNGTYWDVNKSFSFGNSVEQVKPNSGMVLVPRLINP